MNDRASTTVLLGLGLATVLLVRDLHAHPCANVGKAPSLPDDKREQARSWQAEGHDLLERGRPADALRVFNDLYDLTKATSALLDQAAAYADLSDSSKAIRVYQDVARTGVPSACVDWIAERIALLAPTEATLTITCDPADAVIKVDGVVSTETILRASAHEHVVEAAHQGYVTQERPLSLEPGRHKLELKLDRLGTVRVSCPIEDTSASLDDRTIEPSASAIGVKPGRHRVRFTRGGALPPYDVMIDVAAGSDLLVECAFPPSPPSSRLWGVGVGAAGVVSMGLAAYFFLHTNDLVDQSNAECEGRLCSDKGVDLRQSALRSRTLGYVFTGVGAAALGGGVYLYVKSSQDGARPSGWFAGARATW